MHFLKCKDFITTKICYGYIVDRVDVPVVDPIKKVL